MEGFKLALYVKKFGGTSIATIDHIEKVADKIIKSKLEGDDVVVVVSAMGERDRSLGLFGR